MNLPQQQRGAGLLSLVFIFGAIAIVAIVGLKSFPIYANQGKVAKTVSLVASEGSVDPLEVNRSLQRRWSIEDINQIEPKDIKMERVGEKLALTYDYEARTHLFYNIDLVYTFSGKAPINAGGQ